MLHCMHVYSAHIHSFTFLYSGLIWHFKEAIEPGHLFKYGMYLCTYFCYVSDIFDGWLAPYFKSSMDAETWRNGGEPLVSNCSSKYKVSCKHSGKF